MGEADAGSNWDAVRLRANSTRCVQRTTFALVDPEDTCPLCGERRADMLEWIDDDLCAAPCAAGNTGPAQPRPGSAAPLFPAPMTVLPAPSLRSRLNS